MAFLDRNSASPNRLRRNFQRFQASTGLNTPVNPTGGIINTSTGLAVNLTGPGSLLTVSTDGTTVEDLPIGPIGDVLTVFSSSTIGWSTGGSGGGPFLPLSGGTMSGNIVMGTNKVQFDDPNSFIDGTFAGTTILQGNAININAVSTVAIFGSTLTYLASMIPSSSTGNILTLSTNGLVTNLPDGTAGQVLTMLNTSTMVWSTGSGGGGGSTFIVLAGNTGISTSTSTSGTTTSTYIFNTSTGAGIYLPLAGGTMTGAINFSTSANSISDPNYSTLAIKSSTISLTAPGGYIYLNMFPSPASTFGMFLDSIAEIASDGAGNVDFVTTSLSIVGTFKQNQFILDNFGSAFGTTTQVAGPAIGTGGTHGITFLNSPNYSDCAGIIQAHVGTVPALGAVTRVTYGVAFPTGSFVVISPYNENAAALNSVTTVYVTSTTFDGFTLSTGTGALASGTIYQWTYHAIGF